MIFGVDNSSSSHPENRKINLSMLGEGPTYGNNGSFGAPEKSSLLFLVKQRQNFA